MTSKYTRLASYGLYTLAIFIASTLFLLIGHPELLSYQEQYQLFLFTYDYFTARVAIVGGVADYVSEFIVQFYYVPWAGAILVGVVMSAIQLLFAACLLFCTTKEQSLVYALSALPSVLLMYYMGDVNMLLSYPVAILIMLLVTWLTLKAKITNNYALCIALFIVFIALYWGVGPIAILYPLLTLILSNKLKHRWIWTALALVLSCLIIFAINRLMFRQYPESQMYFGINYYRITNQHPAGVFVVPAVILAISTVARLVSRLTISAVLGYATMGVMVVTATILVPSGYQRDTMQALKYDMLVRNEQWHDIIALAEREKPTNDFCLQAVNLALAKTGQLGDRMFQFDQHGISSLISKYAYDNTTCLISAEIFYHLGMINSAFRYNFDLQEAIMNDRKSGRFFKRMAECMIINGQYQIAAKYTNKLKHSLFYSDWAKRAEALFMGEDRTNEVAAWAQKRQVRYKQEMLYDYPEIEKMLGLLAIESGGANPLAWDYFNAATLLKGDLPTFTGMYHYGPELFSVREIPLHHQQAIGMFWTFGHQSFDGLPYSISDKVKSEISTLAKVYSENINRPQVWSEMFKDSYCVYFLKNQAKAAEKDAKGSERGD